MVAWCRPWRPREESGAGVEALLLTRSDGVGSRETAGNAGEASRRTVAAVRE